MTNNIVYFTLCLIAIYLIFDQFAGKKILSGLSDSLWNNNQGGKTITATNV